MKTYNIKQVRNCTIALLSLLSVTSCNDFLDIEPSGIKSGDNYIIDEETALTTINAAYNSLAQHERWGNGMLESSTFFIGEIMADFADMGSVQGDYDDLERMIEWRPYTDEIVLYATWTRCYDGIYRSNYVLESMPDAPISQELKSRIMGEAYFLRGYNTLRLATIFGNIPVPDKVVGPSEYGKVPQSSMHQAFVSAASDFRIAADKLPQKSGYTLEDTGRATKGAAHAMLARLYMLQAGMAKEAAPTTWDSVYHYTTEIIADQEYSLTPNYAQIHEPEGENNCESIFEIQLGASEIVNSGLGSSREDIGSTAQVRCGIRSAENEGLPGGWGYYQPNDLLVAEYEDKDPRISCKIYGPEYNNGVVYGIQRNYNLSEMQSKYYNRQLAIDPLTEAAGLLTIAANGSRNIRVMRYADVLLMNAEAAYHLGKEAEALDMLEQVRDRARNSTFTKGYILNKGDEYSATGYANNLPKVTASGDDLLKAILHERAVELALEDVRYLDLVRTGRYLERLDLVRATVKDPTASALRYENVDLRANCEARSIEGPRGVKDIPIFPIPGEEAIKWNLTQVIGLYK